LGRIIHEGEVKVLLLFANTLADRKLRKTKAARVGILPPLGLGYIAAVLQQSGHQVRILDTRLDPWSPELARQIREFNPGVVGISIFVISELEGYKLAGEIKSILPDVPVVMGGPQVGYFPRAPLERCAAVDITVRGEGEYIMREIVDAMEHGRGLQGIHNILYRDQAGAIVTGPPSAAVPHLEELPFPARELMDLRRYAPEVYEFQKLPASNILATRGCAYGQCTFCFESGQFRTKYRYQSAEKLLREMELLRDEYGIREVVFNDDDLLSNGKLLTEFSELAIQRNLGMKWSCWGRVTPCSKKLLDTIARAGCWLVSFGIESGNQELLDKLQKGMTLEKCRQVVSWAHEAGLETHGTFMIAIPGETPEMAEKTIDFAIELDLTYAAFIPTHPLYGTPLFETCISEGRLVKSPYSHQPIQTRYLPRISFVPEGYKDEKEVEKVLSRAYRRFYFRPAYWWKHFKKMVSGYSIDKYWTGFKFAVALSRGWIEEGDGKFAVRYSSMPIYDAPRVPAKANLLAISSAEQGTQR
jgi:anaerobic magnesium-protoporphyrin IX monomethyl ester cyclase